MHIPHRVAASPAPSPHLGLPPGTLRCGAVHLGAVWPHFVELCLHHRRSRQKPTSCHKALHFWQSARSDTQLHPPTSSTVPSAASPRRPQPPGAPTPLQARDQGCPALPGTRGSPKSSILPPPGRAGGRLSPAGSRFRSPTLPPPPGFGSRGFSLAGCATVRGGRQHALGHGQPERPHVGDSEWPVGCLGGSWLVEPS